MARLLRFLAIAAVLFFAVCGIVDAYNETTFTAIENASLSELPSGNTSVGVYYENGTLAYVVQLPSSYPVNVFGTDLAFDILVAILTLLAIITFITTVRAAYDLISWLMTRRT